MNADGFALLERLKNGDGELVKQIEQCASFAKANKEIELIEFRTLMNKDDIYLESLMVHLLSKILAHIT